MLLPRIVAYDTRDVCLSDYRGAVVLSVSYPGRGLRTLFLSICIQWTYLYVHYLRYGPRSYNSCLSLKNFRGYFNKISYVYPAIQRVELKICNPMELRQLRYFTKAAETGNFSHAAAYLNIAQSSLSQQIKQLEDELGTQLFIRDSHSIQLTEAGEVLLPFALRTITMVPRSDSDEITLSGLPVLYSHLHGDLYSY